MVSPARRRDVVRSRGDDRQQGRALDAHAVARAAFEGPTEGFARLHDAPKLLVHIAEILVGLGVSGIERGGAAIFLDRRICLTQLGEHGAAIIACARMIGVLRQHRVVMGARRVQRALFLGEHAQIETRGDELRIEFERAGVTRLRLAGPRARLQRVAQGIMRLFHPGRLFDGEPKRRFRVLGPPELYEGLAQIHANGCAIGHQGQRAPIGLDRLRRAPRRKTGIAESRPALRRIGTRGDDAPPMFDSLARPA